MKNNILWPVAGLVGVAAGASLSLLFENAWIGYFTAFGVSVLILILMTKSMLPKISPSGVKKTMLYLFGFLVILQSYYSVLTWNQAKFQKDTLREIRVIIESGIGRVESEKLMINTLKFYYLSETDSTLEQHFMKVADDKLLENGSLSVREMTDESDLKLYYEIPASDSIVIYASSVVALGDDPKFENRSGKEGRYEARATLTKRGVRYERQN